MKLSALVVSHHEEFRRDLAQLVELIDPWIEVVSEVSVAGDAIRQVEALRPELVLLDLSLAPGRALQLTERIRCQWPETAVIVIGNEPSNDYRWRSIQAGAIEYVDVLDVSSRLPAALSLLRSPTGCDKGESGSEDRQSAGPLPVAHLRSRIRVAPTGLKHGPFTAWQYVHLCLGLVLAFGIVNLQRGPLMGLAWSLLLTLSVMGVAFVEARQFGRAQRTAERPGCRDDLKGGLIAHHR